MYKLVIVEDERDIRSRIVSLVGKTQRNFEIVSQYETGIDAYDGILTDNPDLILTDIRIPYINGIELAKKVREVLPMVKIILVTGYNEFDYAKEAANLGVVGFISKPVTLEVLDMLLEKAQAALDNEFITAYNTDRLSAFYESNLPIIRENDLFRLSGMSSVPPAFENRLKALSINLDYMYFIVCIFDFDESSGEAESDHYDVAFASVRNALDEDLEGSNDYELFNRGEKLCILIKANTPPDVGDLERRLERVIQRVSRYSDLSLSAGISSVFAGSKNFASMVWEAERSLEYRGVMGGQKVFFFGNTGTPDSELLVDDNVVNELSYILRLKPDKESLEHISRILLNPGGSRDSIYHTATGVLNVLVRACDNRRALYTRYGGSDKLYRRLFEIKTDAGICGYLQEIAISVRELNDEVIVDNVELGLRRITAYMETHFCDPDISFKSMAREVGYSVSYISALLKKNQNTSFMKLLTAMRMEKAQELLANPSLKILDIAERLGYNDSYYFSHCFKKHMGMSPKEFRTHE